jgi:hypothetical protein
MLNATPIPHLVFTALAGVALATLGCSGDVFSSRGGEDARRVAFRCLHGPLSGVPACSRHGLHGLERGVRVRAERVPRLRHRRAVHVGHLAELAARRVFLSFPERRRLPGLDLRCEWLKL